jgi:hypothetical protein
VIEVNRNDCRTDAECRGHPGYTHREKTGPHVLPPLRHHVTLICIRKFRMQIIGMGKLKARESLCAAAATCCATRPRINSRAGGDDAGDTLVR